MTDSSRNGARNSKAVLMLARSALVSSPSAREFSKSQRCTRSSSNPPAASFAREDAGDNPRHAKTGGAMFDIHDS